MKQQLQEILAVAREYMHTYRQYAEKIKNVPDAEKVTMMKTMNNIYVAWRQQIKAYTRLTLKYDSGLYSPDPGNDIAPTPPAGETNPA